jgi:hypothetical protein
MDCDTGCNGNSSENCGSAYRLAVYAIPPTPIPSIGAYNYQGCYSDGRQDEYLDRDLGFYVPLPTLTTLELCAEFCGDEIFYFGVEYGNTRT